MAPSRSVRDVVCVARRWSAWLLIAACAPALAAQAKGTVQVCSANVSHEAASIETRTFTRMLEGDAAANVAISPVSLRNVLSVLYLGADGHTREILASQLGIKGDCVPAASGKLPLESATSLWVQSGISLRRSFLESVKSCCSAFASVLPATAPTVAINQWVSTNTHGRIREVVSSVRPDVALLVVNAAYFKGAWTTPFDVRSTQPGQFQLGNGTRKTVQFMGQRGFLTHHRETRFDWVRLPYGDGRVAMDLLLPRSGSLSASLVAELLAQGAPGAATSHGVDEVRIELPRFALETGARLPEPLSGLGLQEMFDLAKANFGRVAENAQLAVSDIQHKVYIAVNEAGTEAAAATAVTMVGGIAPAEPPLTLRFDKPFLLAIRDTVSGDVLFLASVRNPAPLP